MQIYDCDDFGGNMCGVVLAPSLSCNYLSPWVHICTVFVDVAGFIWKDLLAQLLVKEKLKNKLLSRVPVEKQASSYHLIHWAELTFVCRLPSEILEKSNPKHEDQTWHISLSTQLDIPHQLVGLASRTMFSCRVFLELRNFYFSCKRHRHKQLW